jgi:hypothetical protein
MMLTFEYNPRAGTIEVFFDEEGKALLLKSIASIDNPGDHEHLMTPAWSGWELSGEIQGEGNTLINMVTFGMPRNCARTTP